MLQKTSVEVRNRDQRSAIWNSQKKLAVDILNSDGVFPHWGGNPRLIGIMPILLKKMAPTGRRGSDRLRLSGVLPYRCYFISTPYT